MRRATVTAVTGPLLAALLATATACSSDSGGDGGDGKKSTPVSVAAGETGRTSARITERVKVTSDKGGFELTASGPFDMAKDTGKLSVRMPGGAIDHMDEVFGGGKVYLRPLGNLGKDTWAVIDRDRAQAHYLLRSPANDPEHLLWQVSGMRDVRERGTERIRGERTTHYRGTLGHDTVAARLDPLTLAKVEALREKEGEDLPVTADAWVDGKGRLARVRLASAMGGTEVTITMDLTDFGVAVRVPVPDPTSTKATETTQGLLPG
ncbi:hypothetical protein IHE55_11365 [Streptomyces pactum]|uniref:Lipoprotein n=1 Tax=Streptomyces pactum TaxID=68249 RepID=A0ABS0NJJ0_9ACTN|nr:hypothetical protein [Streptomyces pactum]MBH5335360.1 hypothetical protein [Streptomyces pactum]